MVGGQIGTHVITHLVCVSVVDLDNTEFSVEVMAGFMRVDACFVNQEHILLQV